MALLLLGLGLSTPAVAEPSAALRVSTQTLLDPWAERPGEDQVEQWTRASLSAQAPLGRGTAFVDMRGQHVALWGEGGRESALHLWLGEAGWRGPVGPGWLSAGNLLTPAGQLVALSPLDVLSARDLRAGLSANPADLRLPAPGMVAELGERTVLQLIWLPAGARDRVPLVGTDNSLIRQGMLEGEVDTLSATAASTGGLGGLALGAIADELHALSDRVDPQTRRGAEEALLQANLPEPVVEASEVAARVRGAVGPVHLEALAAWMRSRRPMLALSPAATGFVTGAASVDAATLLTDPPDVSSALTVCWPRTAVLGGGLSAPAGPLLLKGEGAWTSDRLVQRAGLRAVTRPMWSGAAGAEWSASGPPGLLGAELRVEHLRGITDPDGLQFMAETDVQLALYTEWRLARERLVVQAGGLGSATLGELALRPGLRLDLRDGLWLELGGLWVPVSEPAPETLGALLEYAGGPIGALADTEHVRLGLSWAR
ncbi:MAG: hypothetical protein JNM72_04830 [Deltaproteobacteria bacterium]|nr:hypothetical protein [Deltaproteobacteria bacterium]